MKLWNVDVYSRHHGWDSYMVSAENKQDAFEVCRERLENETDHPEHWVIVDAEEAKEND